MTSTTKDTLAEMARGASLVLRNAERLYEEADLLRRNGYPSRSLVLHQISLEECGKIDILGRWSTSLFLGATVGTKKLTSAFRSHKSKNYANGHFAAPQEAELAARERGNNRAAMQAFREFQRQFHDESNSAKNAGLYVDYIDGAFRAPSDVINDELALSTGIVNRYFLNRAGPMTRVISKMAEDDGSLKTMLASFRDQFASSDRISLSSADEAIDAFATEFFKHAEKVGY